MEIDTDRDQRMEQYAQRSAKALENIQSALMLLTALAILAAVVGLAVVLKG